MDSLAVSWKRSGSVGWTTNVNSKRRFRRLTGRECPSQSTITSYACCPAHFGNSLGSLFHTGRTSTCPSATDAHSVLNLAASSRPHAGVQRQYSGDSHAKQNGRVGDGNMSKPRFKPDGRRCSHDALDLMERSGTTKTTIGQIRQWLVCRDCGFETGPFRSRESAADRELTRGRANAPSLIDQVTARLRSETAGDPASVAYPNDEGPK